MGLLLLAAVVASAIPTYDVEKGCRAESALAKQESAYASCVRDELRAKDQVTKNWASYSSEARQACAAGQNGDLDKSYVELMTCFEMQVWSKDLGPLGGPIAGGGAKGGSPPAPGQRGYTLATHPLGGQPAIHIP